MDLRIGLVVKGEGEGEVESPKGIPAVPALAHPGGGEVAGGELREDDLMRSSVGRAGVVNAGVAEDVGAGADPFGATVDGGRAGGELEIVVSSAIDVLGRVVSKDIISANDVHEPGVGSGSAVGVATGGGLPVGQGQTIGAAPEPYARSRRVLAHREVP